MRFLPFFLLLAIAASSQSFYTGADLSYTNELEDCGASYFENDQPKDLFQIFADHNCNIARFRLWHSPTWTNYSTLADVKKSISRAKAKGMKILLDFHYSDTWADPGNQKIPAAWQNYPDLTTLGDSLYNYTYNTLSNLQANNLLPDMVQTGNETNGNILCKAGEDLYPVDWTRNVTLFKRATQAVRDFNTSNGTNIQIAVHIAGSENANWWFNSMKTNGFNDYDIIALSYYPNWYGADIHKVASIIKQLKQTFGKQVMLVETACPWTFAGDDNFSNIQYKENLLKCYGSTPSPEKQLQYLTNLTWLVKDAGGLGVIYWEPGWVSSSCQTPWGTGSSWENSTFFDFNNNLHEGIGFLAYNYNIKPPELEPVNLSLKVAMGTTDTTNGVYVTGDLTGANWTFKRMKHLGNKIFELNTQIPGMSTGAFIFQNKADWSTSSRETVPISCALFWDTHREYIINQSDVAISCLWSSCSYIGINDLQNNPTIKVNWRITESQLEVSSNVAVRSAEIFDVNGKQLQHLPTINSCQFRMPIAQLAQGVYFLRLVSNKHASQTIKLLL